MAYITDKKKGKSRFVVIPPMKMEDGELIVQKDSLGTKIIGKLKKVVGAESLSALIKEKVEKRLKEDKNFQKLCLQHIQNNSIIKPSSEDYAKVISGVQKLKKSGKIKDKVAKKIQNILKE